MQASDRFLLFNTDVFDAVYCLCLVKNSFAPCKSPLPLLGKQKFNTTTSERRTKRRLRVLKVKFNLIGIIETREKTRAYTHIYAQIFCENCLNQIYMPNLGRFTWFARHFSLASRSGLLSSTVQTDAILLAKHCWMLHVSSVWLPCVACAWLLLGIDAQSLSPDTLVATCKRTQQFQTFLSQKLWELFASVLAVVCKRMQHFPTIMLGPSLHFGKNTTHDFKDHV